MLRNRLFLPAAVFAAVLAGVAPSHAQTIQPPQPLSQVNGEFCRLGIYNPFVGAWADTLTITNVGTSQSLIVLNQGGTLTETDAIDLNEPTRNPSPGYGAWSSQDCQNYTVTINKIIYDSSLRQFQTTVLEGTAVLSADGNSWTANLNQQFFNASGAVIRTDAVTATAKRIRPGSTD